LLQLGQRVAQRDPRDTQLIGKRALGRETVAGAELTPVDEAAEYLGDDPWSRWRQGGWHGVPDAGDRLACAGHLNLWESYLPVMLTLRIFLITLCADIGSEPDTTSPCRVPRIHDLTQTIF
jgi:hypothetical protein